MDLFSKYSRDKPKVNKRKKSDKTSNRNGYRSNNRTDYYHDDYKDTSLVSNHSIIRGTTNSTSFYYPQTLNNAKRIFGDDKFKLYKHMKELFAETSTGDVPDLLQYLGDFKSLTSNFLSNKVKYQYKEFISMSRNVLEIEDQMSEMDDMLKSMSLSMKSLHETNFKMLKKQENINNNKNNNIGINLEEQRDREQQEMEVLESMHEQILQHIQLRQLQQATDLIVTAKNEQVNLKQSARKRAMNFINNHIHELEALIVDQLSSTSYLPEIKRDKLSTLLMKLGFVDQAMELFLEHKSKSLKQTIRQISLYGDVKQYIQDLSKVFFDEIINSTIQYTNLLNKIGIVDKQQKEEEISSMSSTNPFDAIQHDEYKYNKEDSKSKSKRKDSDNNKLSHRHSMHMSRLIVWIYSELEQYEKLFEQQVFQLEQNDFRTIGECLKIVFKQSTRLDQSGIHVSFLLSNHFQPSIESAINRLYKKKLESIKKLIRKENYVSKSKNVSNAANKNIVRKTRRLSVKKFKKKQLGQPPTTNPFTQTDRKRSAARYSRISRANNNNNMDKKHARRSSEIFGDVLEIEQQENKQNKSDDENMNELRKLSQRRLSKTKPDDIDAALIGNGTTNRSRSNSNSARQQQQQFTVVKLTKSGQETYEIVKKCIQETWRLLDQRYYNELTKSVYRTVVTQMIYLVQVYSSQITSEINERAPKELTTYRRNLTMSHSHNTSSSFSNKHNRKRRSSSTSSKTSNKTNNKKGVPTIMENEQFGDDDDKKTDQLQLQKKDQLQMPSLRKKKDRNNEAPKILNESQMLSLIANVYYVSEDLLTRIAHRYQKLFGRQIPELELFAIEQQKLYTAQFQQFAKKFLFKWVNHKLLWSEDKICSIYGVKSDISIITKEEIATWSISKEMLGFVRYIVNLRLEIDKYLGSNKDIIILRDSIEILLNELFNGDYIPNINEIDKTDETILISPYGLNRLYLDFRFLMITLHNFLSTNSKNLCTSICEKAKKYVNYKYNLRMEVDWKLMHALGMKLQYRALTGDELDVLNKSYLQQDSNEMSMSSSGGRTRKSSNHSRKNSSSIKNKNNPFL